MFEDRGRLLLGLVSGIAFGFLLQKGRVAKFRVIMGQFLLKDWTVVKIMLSGQAEQAAVDRARREAGLQEFLAKPWNAQELVQAIDQGLRGVLGPVT